MKLITSNVELVQQMPNIDGLYKHIELCGRTAYKSEDKITEDSAEKFVEMLKLNGHSSVFEHGTVYLLLVITPENATSAYEYPSCKFTAHYNWSDVAGRIAAKYHANPYSSVVSVTQSGGIHKYCITTNYRVIYENHWFDDLRFMCEPTEHHERRITLRIQANIHFYKEATRHRKDSFTIESTRFVNYMKEKYGMSISFMQPSWIKEEDLDELKSDCEVIEQIYAKWIDKGYRPEHAAYFLCQGIAATIMMTAFASDWKHFFDVRLYGITGKPHPDVVDICEKAKTVLMKHNLWETIYESGDYN